MNNYLGDFAEDVDVYIVFDTADADGASVTGTIVVADIEVYRQNTGAINLTQRSSTTGFTLDVDHDAMTGTHMVAIDTSDNTDAGFFAVGYDYFVKLNTVTVSGQSISKWIGHFSIENRYKEVNVTEWLGTAVATPGTAGVPSVDVIRWNTGLVATPSVTGVPEVDLTHIAGATTNVSTLATTVNTNLDAVLTARTLATADYFLFGTDTVVNVGTVATLTNLPAITANWITSAGVMAAALDGKGDWNTVTPDAAGTAPTVDEIWDETKTSHVTADSFGVAVKDVLVDTAAMQPTIATNLDAVLSARTLATADYFLFGTDVVANVTTTGNVSGNVDGNVTGTVGSVLGGIDTTGGTIQTLDALDTAQDTQHATTQSTLKGVVPVEGTIGATGNDSTHLHLVGLTYGDNELNGYSLLIFDNSTSEYHVTKITTWVLSSALATVPTLPFTPELSVDTYWLLSAASIASILSDKIALNTTAGVLDEVALLTGNTVQSGDTFGQLPTGFSTLVINSGAVDSLVQGFLNNTIAETTPDNIANNFEVWLDNGNAVTTAIIDDVENIDALINALNDIAASDILTTALTEAYAADGAAGTLTELLYLIQQHLSESSIVTTTKTVKKLDGSTTAATFTLDANPDPTSITRNT